MHGLLILSSPIMNHAQIAARLRLRRQIVRRLGNLQILLEARHGVLSAAQRLVCRGQRRVRLPLRSDVAAIQRALQIHV